MCCRLTAAHVGELTWLSEDNVKVTRGIAVETRKANTMIPDTTDNIVKAGHNGAIFIRLKSSIATALPGLKYDNMDDLATVNSLPFGVDPITRDMVFPWVACKDREWSGGGA